MSRSSAAVIQVDDPEGAALVYQYQNQPLADAMRTMHRHYGTAMLRISNGGCLTGDYYAGRDRRTYGRICFKRSYEVLGEAGVGLVGPADGPFPKIQAEEIAAVLAVPAVDDLPARLD